MPKKKIRVGISSCLLGNHVRYDGEDKRNDTLINAFNDFVEWVPICPEVEAGFPVPREAVRLISSTPHSPRIVTINTGIDHTKQICDQINSIIETLVKQSLCGFIFKSKSPSCGLRDISIYDSEGMPCGKGAGAFSDRFVQRFPSIPVADDIQLLDDKKRAEFMEKAFALSRS